MPPSRAETHEAFDRFVTTYGDKYPKPTRCLAKDQTKPLAFYDFPIEHGVHIRTTNPVESALATVPLGTHKTRGCLWPMTATTMVFKPVLTTQKRWRRLKASDHLEDVTLGVQFCGGYEPTPPEPPYTTLDDSSASNIPSPEGSGLQTTACSPLA